MLAAQRRDLLLERLRRDGRVVAKDLAAELGVSEDSVRRDLREMAAAGLCQRVYGGALPVSPAGEILTNARQAEAYGCGRCAPLPTVGPEHRRPAGASDRGRTTRPHSLDRAPRSGRSPSRSGP